MASVRGDTFDQLLSFTTFRAAGSCPYGDVFGWYEFARGFSASVLRTDVFMVRLPLAIVYLEFAARSTTPHPPPIGGTFPGGEGFLVSPWGVGYVPPKASPWGSWQGAALTDETNYEKSSRK